MLDSHSARPSRAPRIPCWQGIRQGMFSKSAQSRRFRHELTPYSQRLVVNSLPLQGMKFF